MVLNVGYTDIYFLYLVYLNEMNEMNEVNEVNSKCCQKRLLSTHFFGH